MFAIGVFGELAYFSIFGDVLLYYLRNRVSQVFLAMLLKDSVIQVDNVSDDDKIVIFLIS